MWTEWLFCRLQGLKSNELKWFDSHCHFDFRAFDETRESEWKLAHRMGVLGLVIPGITRQQGEKLSKFCHHNPNWYYSLGFHPFWLTEHKLTDIDWLDSALSTTDALAVGECGMDQILIKQGIASWVDQWRCFIHQVELAEAHGKPLVLHIRGAHDQVAAELKRRGFSHAGLVHAFTGSEQQAKVWSDLGFCLGVGGAISYPKASRFRRTLAAIPIENLLLETDSPDMKPAFLRNASNTPAMIPLYAAILSSIKKIELSDLSIQLDINLQRVFGL